jgi:hypothetical protein
MKKTLLLSVAALFFVSCASIISGSDQMIKVDSNIEGATITIIKLDEKDESKKTINVGKTPFNGKIPRIKNAVLQVEKAGYKTQKINMSTETNMVFLLNILSGGTTGTSTDYSTGALFKYSPGSYMANLEPGGNAGIDIDKFRKESLIRIFSIVNFDKLNKEIAAGKGKYINTLYELYGAETKNDKDSKLSDMRGALEKSHTIPGFAEMMVRVL